MSTEAVHRTKVTVIVPLLNDEHRIGDCLAALSNQAEKLAEILEILVVDGGSTDGSLAIVERARASDMRIAILHNPERFVSHGMNLGVRRSRGDVIVRVDSHTVVAHDYTDAAIRCLTRGADVVGGPMRPEGTSEFGRAVAWALTSRWGIGGSRFHHGGHESEADAVYMGVFPRKTFERFGLYHPAFVRNQDDELTYRIREEGGTVWLTDTLHSSYETRSQPRALFKQFFGYGRYKPAVLARHRSGARLRHFAPLGAVIGWLLLAGAPVDRRLALPSLVHVTAVVAASSRGSQSTWARRAVALFVMHLAYGSGFAAGLAAYVKGERAGPPPQL